MSEELPPAVTRNFMLHQSEQSPLLIAQANHVYTEHPHPYNEPEHRFHGLTYETAEVGGKPLVIAKRFAESRPGGEVDQSQAQEQSGQEGHAEDTEVEEGQNERVREDSDWTALHKDKKQSREPRRAPWGWDEDWSWEDNRRQPNEQHADDASEAPREEYEYDDIDDTEVEHPFSSQIPVRYQPDERGMSRIGLEYAEPGDEMDWVNHRYADGPERRIILQAEDGSKYYVRGGMIYDLSKAEQEGQIHAWELDDHEELPNAIIGEHWRLASDLATSPIEKVEIRYKLAADTEENREVLQQLEPRGKDPFRAADELINGLQEELDSAFAPTEVYEPVRPPSPQDMRGRIRIMMRRAFVELGDPTYVLADKFMKKIRTARAAKPKRPKKTRTESLKNFAGDVRNTVSEKAGQSRLVAAARYKLPRIKEYVTEGELREKRRRITGTITGALAVGGVAIYQEVQGRRNAKAPEGRSNIDTASEE